MELLVYGASERMSDGFIFYLGMMAGIFSLAIFQVIVWRVRERGWLQRRPVSRTEQRYTPERKDSTE